MQIKQQMPYVCEQKRFSSVSYSKMKKLFSHVTHLGSHLIFDANQGIYSVNVFLLCFMQISSSTCQSC